MKKITVVGAGSAGCFTALFNSVYFNTIKLIDLKM